MPPHLKTPEYKTVSLDLKELNEDGTFEGYAAVYQVKDLGGDIIELGAFKRSIDHKGGKFPILAAHDVHQEVGLAELAEDDYGIKVVRGKLYISTNPLDEIPEARKAYIRMRRRKDAGMPMGMSIGYETLQHQYQGNVRHIKEARLWEISVDVTFPMNPLAGVTDVKTLTADEDAAIVQTVAELKQASTVIQTLILAKSTFPTVAEARKWVREHDFKSAGVDETDDSWRFRQIEPTKCQENTFRTITITDGVKAVVCRPTEESSTMPPAAERKEGFAQTFAQIQQTRTLSEERWQIDSAFWQSCSSILCDADLTGAEKLQMLQTSLGEFQTAFMSWANRYVAVMDAQAAANESLAADLDLSLKTALFEAFRASVPIPPEGQEDKAGRVLSRRNRTLISQAVTQLTALLAATEDAGDPAKSHAPASPGAPAPADPASDSGASHAETISDEDAQAFLTDIRALTGR